MKKLMSIFGIMLFAFALTLTSCGETANEEVAVCANIGESCLDDHSCCAPAPEEPVEEPADEELTDEEPEEEHTH